MRRTGHELRPDIATRLRVTARTCHEVANNAQSLLRDEMAKNTQNVPREWKQCPEFAMVWRAVPRTRNEQETNIQSLPRDGK